MVIQSQLAMVVEDPSRFPMPMMYFLNPTWGALRTVGSSSVEYTEINGVVYAREKGTSRLLLFDSKERVGGCFVLITRDVAFACHVAENGFPRPNPTFGM